MSTAFQSNAFQNNAFQITATTSAGMPVGGGMFVFANEIAARRRQAEQDEIRRALADALEIDTLELLDVF